MGYLTDNRMSKLCYHGRPTLCSDYRTCDKCHEHIYHATAACKIQMLKNDDEFIAEKLFLKFTAKDRIVHIFRKLDVGRMWQRMLFDIVN